MTTLHNILTFTSDNPIYLGIMIAIFVCGTIAGFLATYPAVHYRVRRQARLNAVIAPKE